MNSDRAERIYRRLLVLLPATLRQEARDELLEVFVEAHTRATARGRAAVVRFWLLTFADIAVTSVAERQSQRRRRDEYGHPRPLSRSLTMRLTRSISNGVSDFRLAVRRLGKAPGWTLISSGTLAMGLAASVLATVLVRDVLLRPLPFPRSDRLVRILEVSANGGRWWPSFPNAADWRERARMFEGVGIADVPRVVPVTLDGRAVRVPVSRAAAGLFDTLGVRPVAGRLFADRESRPGGDPVALVSERFWRRDLASRPPGESTLGIGQEQFSVVGVLPASFRFLGDGGAWSDADVWTPLERDTNLGSRTTHGYHVVARLRDGMSLDQARVEMNHLVQMIKAGHGQPTQADTALLTPLQDVVIRSAREPLTWLIYAAGAVLFVSCLNLAAAILARGLNRGRELSVRLALGASRAIIARHLLVEAAALSLPGALLGTLTAGLALRIVRTSGAGMLPRVDEAALDGSAAALALGLAAVTTVLAGGIPALVLSRPALMARLRAHQATGPREHRRLWTGFVVAQVALTVLLLTGTGLLIRSFAAALAVDLGYNPRNVLAVDVALPESAYAEGSRRLSFYDSALDRLRSSPGIRSAGLTSVLPHVTSMHTSYTRRDAPDATGVLAGYRLVDTGYFETIGIPRGPGADRLVERGAAAVDRMLLDTLWGGDGALGDRVLNGFSNEPLTVTGIVGSVREWHQSSDGIGAVYVDFHRRPDRTQAMHFVVGHQGDRGAAVESVRQAIAAVDPMVPVTIEPLDMRVAESLGGRRLVLLLASGFGIAALLLASAGVYALVSFMVTRQLRESAIRLALGAGPSALRRRILVQGLVPAAAGAGLGLAMAVPAGRAMAAQLFQVQASDPAVLASAGAAVIAAAALASLMPARRAARVDPAAALRAE
ncbi:MAG TPA: ABC transporter permease [Vicinamibacterales bacterium]|nr:ABC transporter permease [Vicinamibacterales bacterium]